MAATEFGKDTRMKYGDAAGQTPPVTLGGEGSFDWTAASTDVDTTDKDGPAGLYIPGRIGFAVSGNIKLPDPAFSLIVAAATHGTPLLMTIVKSATVRYSGLVTVGNLKGTFGSTGAVPYSFDATAYATPTVNAIDAVPA